MSILIELAGAVAGMLSEYMQKKGWGAKLTFFASFGIFFSMGFIASFFYKSEVGLIMEMFYSFILGIFMGSIFLSIFLFKKHRKR